MPLYVRVEIPMLEVLPIRKAEAGMTLEKTAFNNDGQVVAEAGKQLTEETIRRLQNLDVRKIVVSDTNLQWIPKDEVDDFSREVNIVDMKDFDDAAGEIVKSLQTEESINEIRRTALYLRNQASKLGDAGGITYLDDIIERSYDLEEEINSLKERLPEVDDDASRKRLLRTLESKVRELDEVMMEVNAPDSLVKNTVSTWYEKQNIRSVLTEFVSENPEVLETQRENLNSPTKRLDLEEDQFWTPPVRKMIHGNILTGIKQLCEHVSDDSSPTLEKLETLSAEISEELDEKRTIKEQISEFELDLEERKTIVDVLDGRTDLLENELTTLPISERFASEIVDLTKREMDSRYRLWEVLQSIAEDDVSSTIDKSKFLKQSRRIPEGKSEVPDTWDETSGLLSRIDLYAVLDYLERGKLREAAQTIRNSLDKNDRIPDETVTDFKRMTESLYELEQRRAELTERIRQSTDNPDLQATLEELLDRERVLAEDELFELDAGDSLLENVSQFMRDYKAEIKQLWRSLDALSDQELENREDASENDDRIEEKIREVAESLSLTEFNVSIESMEPEAAETTSIRETINQNEDYQLANQLNMDLATVQNARKLMREPEDLSSEQELYLDPLLEETYEIFYERDLDEDRLRDVSINLAERLAERENPLDLLLKPPSGDSYLLTHGINTCVISLSIADRFRLDDTEIFDLTTACLCLDLGMMEVPTGLWAESQSLSDRAGKEVEKHPVHSRDIVSSAVNGDDVIMDLVYQHHERTDGSGYPRGLTVESLHPLAPLLGTADAYVAMLEKRVYRNPMSPDTALTALVRSKESYDQSVIKALAQTIGVYPTGSVVAMEDGRLAMVDSQNQDQPLQPTVQILTDPDEKQLDEPERVELASEDLVIREIVEW